MSRRFQRCIESFSCMHCGADVEGDGYTNHCPYCLWSRHVDINPGDREEKCGGAMQPVKAGLERGRLVLTHHCLSCGKTRKNKAADRDNYDAILELMRAPSPGRLKQQRPGRG